MNDEQSNISQFDRLRNVLAETISKHGDVDVQLSSLAGLLEQLEAIGDDGSKVARPESAQLSVDSEKPQVNIEPQFAPVPESAAMAQYQAKVDDWLGQREHSRQWDLENFRQILNLGQNALRNTALINGGAAIALLAFSGNMLQKGGDPTEFAAAMAVFGVGVFVSVLAMATTYVSQLAYGGEKSWHVSAGKVFHIFTAILALCALLIFVKGIKMGYDGLNNYTGPSVSLAESEEKRNAPPPSRPAEQPPEPPLKQPKDSADQL